MSPIESVIYVLGVHLWLHEFLGDGVTHTSYTMLILFTFLWFTALIFPSDQLDPGELYIIDTITNVEFSVLEASSENP